MNPNVCSPCRSGRAILILLSVAAAAPVRLAAQAAVACPGYNLPAGPNLVRNPDFELTGPCGAVTWWLGPNQHNCGVRSAARDWTIHSSNDDDPVWTTQVASTLPIGGRARMLRIRTNGNEGGVFQPLPAGLKEVMATVWVYVRRGRIVLGVQAMNNGPYAWSTKVGQWEQLRICTNGAVPVDTFFVYNEDPAGGDFDIDRAELKVIN